MLGRMESDSAIPHLTRLLSDPAPAVRASAVSSLGALYADSTVDEIILLLDDPDEQVREEALTVLPKLKAIHSPELIAKVSNLVMNDASLSVQKNAIIALLELGVTEEAISYLTSRLNADDPRVRVSALETVSEIAPHLNFPVDQQTDLETPSNNSSSTVRRAAISALGSLKS